MDHLTFAQLLGNYGEFVGAIAVVVTLGYLAMQIRQNTSAVQSSRLERQFGSLAGWYEQLNDPDAARVWSEGVSHYQSLSRGTAYDSTRWRSRSCSAMSKQGNLQNKVYTRGKR